MISVRWFQQQSHRQATRWFFRSGFLAMGFCLGEGILAVSTPAISMSAISAPVISAPVTNTLVTNAPVTNAPANPQRIRLEDIGPQVYQAVPSIPLENEYVSRDTGDVSPDNTLVSRLVRYHIYTKNRPITYRLDWKLTLADYLGANERMDVDAYPSATSLRTNPMSGDVTAIRSLTRAQRNALVNALVNAFNPNAITSEPQPETDPALTAPVESVPAQPATPPPAPPSNPRFPPQPQPGDAQLLQP